VASDRRSRRADTFAFSAQDDRLQKSFFLEKRSDRVVLVKQGKLADSRLQRKKFEICRAQVSKLKKPREQQKMGEMIKPPQRIANRAAEKKWQIKYVQENPIKVGSATVLGIGGVLLLIFFARLNFMPDIDLANSTAVLAAVALIGLLVVSFVSFTTFIPGIGTRYVADELDIAIDGYAATAMIVPALSLIILIVLHSYDFPHWIANWEVNYILGFVASLALLLSTIVIARSEDTASPINLSSSPAVKSPKWARAFGLWLATMLWTLGIFFTFYIFLSFARGGDRSELELLGYSGLWLLFAALTNIGIAMFKSAQLWRAVLIMGPVSCYLLLILSGNFSVISVMAIKALGLGEIGPVRVVLTAQACNALNQSASGKAMCHIPQGQTLGYVCPATIRSRIGGQVLIDVGEPKSDNYARIVVNKDDVVTWAITQKQTRKNAPEDKNNSAKVAPMEIEKKSDLKEEREKQLTRFCA